MSQFLMYKLSQSVCDSIPRQLAYSVADCLMDAYYLSSSKMRKVVENNLQLALRNPTSDLPYNVRQVFRNFGRYMVDFFQINHVDREFMIEHVRVSGLRNLRKALSHRRGGIILTAHLGNWELGGAVLSRMGYPSLGVALPHEDPEVNEFFNHKRTANGLETVTPGLAFRRCLQRLKQRKLVSIVGDYDFSGHGETVAFLGRETSIPKGPAVMSLRTGAPIIPTFMIRDDNDHYVLTIGEPIFPPAELTSENRVEPGVLKSFVQKYIQVLESEIIRHPSQWLMFRKICAQ